MPIPGTMILHAGHTPVRTRFNSSNHREIAHFGPCRKRAWDPNSQRRALRVSGAAEPAEATIGAWRAVSLRPGMGGRQCRKRRLGPVDADRLAASRKQFTRGVQLMCAIRVTRPLRSPRIRQWPRDVDLPLSNSVIMPHLLPRDRPVRAVTERRARLKPFGAEAQRHHRIMDGRPAHGLARIVATHLDGVRAVEDTLIGPV